MVGAAPARGDAAAFVPVPVRRMHPGRPWQRRGEMHLALPAEKIARRGRPWGPLRENDLLKGNYFRIQVAEAG